MQITFDTGFYWDGIVIAGAIATFVSQASLMKYLGAGAPKAVAYGVAAVSGTVLAVCSCTVLPLFAGIYVMGAGIGPADAGAVLALSQPP